MADPQSQAQAPQAQTTTAEVDDLRGLLEKSFKPKTDRAREAIQNAVQTLAAQALAQTALVSDDATRTIRDMIAQIDVKLAEQVNQVLHHEDFRQLEGTWRGLHHFVSNTETDETLKIRVMNISKKDVQRELRKYKGVAWDQSPLFKKIYEQELGTAGGEPYGCLIGDYAFNHTAPDVDMLSGIAQIAAAAHAPFIAAGDPSLMNMDCWTQLGNPSDLTSLFQTAEYAPWRALRESEDSRYIGLAMPRFLARLPYSVEKNPVEEFAFEEDTGGGAHDHFVWSNAAFAMARNIAQAFKLYGWCARIRGAESGGLVDGLPCHTFPTDDGGVDMTCPTEIAITDRREAELAKNGLMPLLHYKNTTHAVFMGAQSLHKPAEYFDPDATASDEMGSRLPYLFAMCRFAHYLKSIVRDRVGGFTSRQAMQNWLEQWILNYVEPDPEHASEERLARKPLAEAQVEVEEVEGKPGYYSAVFRLKPHFQLEGLKVSLRLVSKLKENAG